uniref:Replication-associated protein n=1 Tax=Manihot esculenta associated ampelovirus 2 TaxID=2843332 RepID=A0A8F1SZ74_9CLOS|nr:replication-associated protein [Manihot esculenta associated ampelovirus 2]
MSRSLPHLDHKTYSKATPAQKARRNPPPPIRKLYSNKEYASLLRYQTCYPSYVPIYDPLNYGYFGPRPFVGPSHQVLPPSPMNIRPVFPKSPSPTKSVNASSPPTRSWVRKTDKNNYSSGSSFRNSSKSSRESDSSSSKSQNNSAITFKFGTIDSVLFQKVSPPAKVGGTSAKPSVNRVKGSVQFGRTQPLGFQPSHKDNAPRKTSTHQTRGNFTAAKQAGARHNNRAQISLAAPKAPKSTRGNQSSLSPPTRAILPQITLKTLREAKERLAQTSTKPKSVGSTGSSSGSRFSVLASLESSEGSSSTESPPSLTLKTVRRWVAKGTITPSPVCSLSPSRSEGSLSPVKKVNKGKQVVHSSVSDRHQGGTKSGMSTRNDPSSSSGSSPHMGDFHYNYGRPFVSHKAKGVALTPSTSSVLKLERGSSSNTKPTSNVRIQAEAPKRREGFRATAANIQKAEAMLQCTLSTAREEKLADTDKENSLTAYFQSLLKNMRGPVRVRVSGRTGERLFCKVADEIGYRVGPTSVSRVLTYIYGDASTPTDINFIISKRGWAHVFQNGFYVGYAPLSMPKWTMLRLAGEQRVYPTIIGNNGVFQIRNKDRWPTLQEYIMYDLFHGYSRLDAVYVYDPVTRRAVKGSSGFCWLPLYLKSGCSIVEIPSCPYVKKGVLEAKFGPQKYVRVHNKLHLSPTYGKRIVGESDRLVGASEIEEITESLPNLTTDSSLGEMVNNVLRKTVLSANSRFAMTLDEVLQNALTTSFTSKKATRIRIPQSLTTEERQLLETVWGHNNFDYGSNTPSPHAFLNAMRTTFNAEYIRGYKHLSVSDVGGNTVAHVLQGSTNVHVCNPICDTKDIARQINSVPSLMNEALKTTRKIEDFNRFVLSLNAISYCRRPLGKCTVPSSVITMVDVYDISLQCLLEGMEAKGAIVARLCFMFPPELIYKDGCVVYPHTNLTVERLNETVIWTVGSCGDVYCHDVQNVLSYLTTGRIVSSSKLLYNVELVAQRGPYMDIAVTLTQGSTPLLSPKRRFVCWRDGFSSVKVILTNPKPQVITVYLDRDFCRRTLMYLGNVCTSFEDRTFEYAVSALRSNMTMMVVGAKIVHKKVEISNNIILEVASSLLKEAVTRRSKTVKFHRSIYSVPSRLYAFLQRIITAVGSVYYKIKDWIFGPDDSDLSELLSGKVPYVEDTPSCVDVDLTDMTSNVNVAIEGLDEVFDLAAQLSWVTQVKVEDAKTSENDKEKPDRSNPLDDLDGLDIAGTSADPKIRGGGGNWYDFLINNRTANPDGDSVRGLLWRLCRKITRVLKYWDTIPVLKWAKIALGMLLCGLKWIFSRTLCPTLPEEEVVIPETSLWEKIRNWGGALLSKSQDHVNQFLSNCASFVCTKTISIIQHCQNEMQKCLTENTRKLHESLNHKIACFMEEHNLPFWKKNIKPVLVESRWKKLSTAVFKFLVKAGPPACGLTIVGATTYILVTNETVRNQILKGWRYLNLKVFQRYYVDKVKAAYLLIGALISRKGLSISTLLSTAPSYYLLSAGSLGRRLLCGDLSATTLAEGLLLLNRIQEFKDIIHEREEQITPVIKITVDTHDALGDTHLRKIQGDFKSRIEKALTTDLSKGKPSVEEVLTNQSDNKVDKVEVETRLPLIPKDVKPTSKKGKEPIDGTELSGEPIRKISPTIVEETSEIGQSSTIPTSTNRNLGVQKDEEGDASVPNAPLHSYLLELQGERKDEDVVPPAVPDVHLGEEEIQRIQNEFLDDFCGVSEVVPEPQNTQIQMQAVRAELDAIATRANRAVMDDDDERNYTPKSEDSFSTISLSSSEHTEVVSRSLAYESSGPSSDIVAYRPNYENVRTYSAYARPLPVKMILDAVGLPVQILNNFLPNIPPTAGIPRWLKISCHTEISEFVLYTTHEAALIKAMLQRAVESSLIWDKRRKMLVSPIMLEQDKGELKMFTTSKPFGRVTTTLEFYPTVVGDHSTKRIGMAEELYNSKGPFFCMGDPQITHSVIRLQGALKSLEYFDVSRAENKTLRFVNAVPGAGKTFMIIQAAKATTARMLILTANRASCDELKTTLYRRIKERMVVVATLDSAIMHIDRLLKAEFQSVCIDECYMVHVGQIRLLLGVIEATDVTLYGDRRQIPFINRLKGVGISHSFMQPDKQQYEEKLVTYRCPADICYWMSQLKFGNEMAYSGRVMSKSKIHCIKSVRAHPIQSFTPKMGEGKDKIIVFTQWEKEKLSADLRNSSHHDLAQRVATVHECQGKTYERVALVRIKPAQDEVFTSAPHRLVALTRHTTSLDFYCIRNRMDQGIGRDVELIEKVTEHVARTFLIEQCS